ncbi:MAG TPA: hypothetical protein VGR90_08500 [Acidimicrobiales bacterium]|nr:hypothetical protein [Acidimicrobiales bacterium]
MRFLVMCRAIEPAPIGFPDQIELLEATQQRFADNTDPRIGQVLSFAGERSFAMVIEARTAAELDRSVFALPAEPLMIFEVHALIDETSVELDRPG